MGDRLSARKEWVGSNHSNGLRRGLVHQWDGKCGDVDTNKMNEETVECTTVVGRRVRGMSVSCLYKAMPQIRLAEHLRIHSSLCSTHVVRLVIASRSVAALKGCIGGKAASFPRHTRSSSIEFVKSYFRWEPGISIQSRACKNVECHLYRRDFSLHALKGCLCLNDLECD